jgi:hypothetical protein
METNDIKFTNDLKASFSAKIILNNGKEINLGVIKGNKLQNLIGFIKIKLFNLYQKIRKEK